MNIQFESKLTIDPKDKLYKFEFHGITSVTEKKQGMLDRVRNFVLQPIPNGLQRYIAGVPEREEKRMPYITRFFEINIPILI